MIGIDIGNNFIKACRIEHEDRKGISVFTSIQNVLGKDISQKKMVIEDLLKKMNVEKDICFVAVGGSDIICRDIILSKLKANSKDLKKYVLEEVQNSITEDLSSMYSAYTITRDVSDKEVCVIFSAVQKANVSNAISLLDSVKKFPVVGVEMESLALANAFVKFAPAYKETESILLLNIGDEVTNIVVLNNKDVVFVKDVDFGGKNITKDIASIYMIPERLAEEIKIRVDLREKINFNMRNVLKKSVSSLIETIFRTIEHCVTRQFILAVDRIVITGGASLTDGIDIFIEETLGINTEKWNPLENNNIVGYCSKDHGYFIPIALGLALEKEKK